MNLGKAQFMRLISPSFLSGTVSLLFGALVVVGVLSPYIYRGSYLEQYGETIRQYPGGLGDTYASIVTQLNSSEIVGNVSIFFSWAIIGFIIYYLGLMAISFFINITTFAHILGYKNTDKKSFLLGVSERLALRVLGLAGLIAWVSLGLYLLVPSILTLIAASYSSSVLTGGLYLIASLVFLLVWLHISVILLRLAFLRLRLISWMYQASDA